MLSLIATAAGWTAFTLTTAIAVLVIGTWLYGRDK